ncbi:hypothetical protein I316_01358 [Kwoniella heveanensis BCC8398]|uniref:Exosome complex protein n=1 Tax=Kwoniella heveanensis BCC8398 TaxID=1296120 RepID=A0A1B9H0G1_9TREE|nr:hypothetical protein I316_01358 [Kwoniella heveanensis BCC8398]
MADEFNPATTLSALTKSLDVLENALKPLQTQEWSSTLEELSTLERAKMDVLASYAVNDLIWVYLKLKGIDPEKHDVSAELDRIKTYYAKVRAVEEPDAPRPQIDSAAAKRFIKSSIPKSQHLKPNSNVDADLPTSSAAALVASQARDAASVTSLRQQQEDEQEALPRLGKAGRFRFIDQKGDARKRIIPGSENANIEDEEEEGEGEDIEVDGDEPIEEVAEVDDEAANASGMTEEAEEFLRGIEEEMKATRTRTRRR